MSPRKVFLVLAGALVILATRCPPREEALAESGWRYAYLPAIWNAVEREALPNVPTAAVPATTATLPQPTPGESATAVPSPAPTEEPTAEPTETPSPTGTPTAEPTPALAGSIFGRLLQEGKPVFPGTGDGLGPGLFLRHCKAGGSECSHVMRTGAWEPNGGYRFVSPPPLQPGEFYQVVWWNEDKIPDLAGDYTAIGRWFGPRITQFNGTEAVRGGDIELENVRLTAPSKGTGFQGFPIEFAWAGRSVSGESFRWAICDCCLELAQRDKTIYMTSSLGSARRYAVESLPPGVQWNVHYCWYVRIESGTAYSFGESFYANMLWFIPLFFEFGATRPESWYPAPLAPSAHTWWSERW